jgi:outer membrane lipoprotein-sorting protein
MQYVIRIISVALFLCVMPALVQAKESRAEALARVEQYLSDLTTIVADFSQVAPSGEMSSGKFYLKRPQKMRWQYNPPTPILMVTRGSSLTYYDYELNQVTDIPLEDTLLSFLSKAKISFADKAIKVSRFEQESGLLRVTVVQAEKPKDGALLLEFSDHPIRLYNMQITDATGQTTSVSLSNARFDMQLEDSVFAFKDPRLGTTAQERRRKRGAKP